MKLVPSHLPLVALTIVLLATPAPGARKQKKQDNKPANAGQATKKKNQDDLDPKRVGEIAALLPKDPQGPGRPITDRAFWSTFAQDPAAKEVIQKARKTAAEPLPPLPDELYLEFSKNGNRRNYEQVAFGRRNRLTGLVLAECMTNTGEFLPAIEKLVGELCKERTWVLPAHDKKLTNFNRTNITIDLFSSALGWQLAMTDYLLEDKLNPATRQQVRHEVNRQILEPFQAMIRNQRRDDVWFKRTNNWNPVCFAGVTGAGLILLESPRDRAEFIASAEHYSRYFLDGFTSDGYCSEGVGYWNYGYGNYSMMAQNFRLATGGQVDLFKLQGAAEPAAYGARISIVDGVVPAFADCSLKAQPARTLLQLLNSVYGWKIPEYSSEINLAHTVSSLSDAMLYHSAGLSNTAAVAASDSGNARGLRTAFDEAGVFICRPPVDTNLAVAFKGGNNNEQHNHNDIGSYVVVAGKSAVLVDPGTETYTAKTFGPQRYESKMLNSFGHPVPVVAGKLQEPGAAARAQVIQKEFSDTKDVVVIDYTSAYNVPELKKLTRKFEFDRTGRGSFVITDTVEFNKPSTFETAMISLGDFQVSPDGKSASVRTGNAGLNILVQSDAPWVTGQETIKENAPVQPRRLAIKMRELVSSATVITTIMPQ